MFERYLVCEDGFRNVRRGAEVIGFQVKSRISYFRSMPLSMIEDVGVKVDGRSYAREQIRVGLRAGQFTLEQMKSRHDLRWQFAEDGVLTVLAPGGLAPGLHDVEVSQLLRLGLAALPPGQAVLIPLSVGKRRMTLVV